MAKNKTKWKKETPAKEGWYWVKYRGKHGMTTCPAHLMIFKDGTRCLHSARNDFFVEGPGHGGLGMKYNGKLDKTLSFGPSMRVPK
jgi:hypothetical protein